MDKQTLTERILKVLTMVPIPFVPEAARVAEAILVISHEAHAEAAAAGEPPPTLDELQAALIAALPLAQEPWRRVQDTADAELGRSQPPKGDLP